MKLKSLGICSGFPRREIGDNFSRMFFGFCAANGGSHLTSESRKTGRKGCQYPLRETPEQMLTTFGEMAAYFVEKTGRIANRASVGRYTRKLGYKVYKPMVDRKIHHYYLNHSIDD